MRTRTHATRTIPSRQRPRAGRKVGPPRMTGGRPPRSARPGPPRLEAPARCRRRRLRRRARRQVPQTRTPAAPRPPMRLPRAGGTVQARTSGVGLRSEGSSSRPGRTCRGRPGPKSWSRQADRRRHSPSPDLGHEHAGFSPRRARGPAPELQGSRPRIRPPAPAWPGVGGRSRPRRDRRRPRGRGSIEVPGPRGVPRPRAVLPGTGSGPSRGGKGGPARSSPSEPAPGWSSPSARPTVPPRTTRARGLEDDGRKRPRGLR